MSVGRHFGLLISRLPQMTYAATTRAAEDCRFVCSACYGNCWGMYRLHGETAWLCSQCADMKDNGLTPGPRPFDTQPSRQLHVGEQLRSRGAIWTVTGSQRVPKPGDGLNRLCVYALTRDDGHEQTWRAGDMADFHLIPAAFEHITRARCNELAAALTTAGLPWQDNGRQSAPKRLEYAATGPRGCQWSIRPAPGAEFDPAQPSNLWRAECAAQGHQTPVMSAHSLTERIRRFPA
ncbi:hypothetical protein [Streptomyces sp. bgisy034]|uniref:hypothetical protein n=1 Tax=Streptomyces sp. bgisy034 TaxID=3413774 RepID=UPI003EBBD8FE